MANIFAHYVENFTQAKNVFQMLQTVPPRQNINAYLNYNKKCSTITNALHAFAFESTRMFVLSTEFLASTILCFLDKNGSYFRSPCPDFATKNSKYANCYKTGGLTQIVHERKK